MSDVFTIESQDFIKLQETFKELEYADQKKIISTAFRRAVNPTVNLAKANAHVKTGNLRRSIGAIMSRDEASVVVGARKRGGFKGYHGLIVEEGTVDRYYTTKRGKKHFTGKMSAGGSYAGFLRKAVDATEGNVFNNMYREWSKAMDRFLRKRGLK